MAAPVSNQKILEASVRANRRCLELLDQQLAEVSKVYPSVTDDLLRARQSLPFSYVVDFSGAPAANAAGTPVSGYVNVQSDSAFLLDGIYIDQQTLTVQRIVNTWLFDMKITDVSNGHEVTLIGRDDRAVAGSLTTPLGVAAQAFVTWNQLGRGRVQMPAEAAFPRNALLRVDLFSRTAINFSTTISAQSYPMPRNFIVLTGTKIFGG